MQSQVSNDYGSNGKNRRSFGAQEDRTLSHGEPARPLLRVLPIKRWIPQDVHSIMDYAGGLMTGAGYFTADCDDVAAQIGSLALGGSVIGVSLLTDYRLSVAKVIPIRAHESLDFAWGASCIALPFILGYWKSSPTTAISHIATGAGTILASLFTDYRSYKEQRAAKRRERRMQKSGMQGAVMPT